MLAMGGISLGKAVQSSGLLSTLTQTLTPLISTLTPFESALTITAIIAVATTFISHTVGAVIILPIISPLTSIPRTLVLCGALMCSGAMGLPVSSFPNMNAAGLEDWGGNAWVGAGDFLVVGGVGTGVVWMVVNFVGFWVLKGVGFG